MRGWSALAALAALAPAACTVGPDFEPVPITLPAAYTAPIPTVFAGSGTMQPWWTAFDDPVLTQLVEESLDRNLDVLSAASELREARAAARGVRARTGPEVIVGGEATGENRVASSRDRGDDSGASLELFLEGAYEVDVFGGEARSRQAAEAEALRSARLAADARRLVTAEVARAYVELRAVERGLALTERLLALQRRTVELVRNRVQSGLAPGLDLVRAQAAVATLEADLGPLRRDLGRFRNALAVLLGEPAGAVTARLEERRPIPTADLGTPLGVPGDLLRRRPDIQAAELAVAAATAEVGVATAELYPSFNLPTSLTIGPFGVGAADVVEAVIASIALLVDFPLYDGGAREADVSAAEERVVQATLAYRDTVLTSVEEVESALLGTAGARDRRDALRIAVDRNRRAFEQSQQLYRDGFASFLDVLDSQRELTTTLQDLARAERDVSLEVVNLFAALGGAEEGPASVRAQETGT